MVGGKGRELLDIREQWQNNLDLYDEETLSTLSNDTAGDGTSKVSNQERERPWGACR